MDTEVNVLRLSTDLQTELIRKPTLKSDLHVLLDSIVAKASEVLQADASAIYIVDSPTESEGTRTATMRAAQGYQSYAVDVAQCVISSPEEASNQPKRGEELGLTGWVISTGRSFLAKSPDDVMQHPHWSGKYDNFQKRELAGTKVNVKELKLAAFLAVPVRNPQGQVIGALKAERLEGKDAFSVNNQIVLETLARVAGRCITYDEYARQGHVNEAITSWTRDVIAEAVATEGELDAFLDIVVQVTAAATEADSCAVFLIDESNQTLTQRAGCGSQVLRRVIRSYRLPNVDQLRSCTDVEACNPPTCCNQCDTPREQRVGITAWVAATGKSFNACNLEELRRHCHHRGEYDRPNYFEGDQECGAWLGVPLLVGGTIIGVLKTENVEKKGEPSGRYFTPEIQQRFDVLAQDIALSIRRLQIQSPARYQVIKEAMPTILVILQGGLDVRALVEKVVKETAKLFDARACALFLKEGNQLIQPPWAAVGYALQSTGEGAAVRRYTLVTPDQIVDASTSEQKVGLTVWIAVKQEKFTAKSNLELISHPHHKGFYDIVNFDVAKGERCESFMGIPLLAGKELVGVLKVETKQKEVGAEKNKEYAYFNEQDELVFELIANSAAIAIQNARLLESRRLAERIINQPTPNRVMFELYDFIRGRDEVVSTLDSTADAVRDRDPAKARIIQSFAGVLKPDFHIAILEQLAEQVESPIDSLLDFLAIAIRVEGLNQICSLSTRELQMAALRNTDFYSCAKILLDTLRQVSDHLERYEDDHTLRLALQDSINTLRDAESRVERMDLFERSVLRHIFAHWREVIEARFGEFHEVRNPYVAGRPLDPGSPVFVGREEIFRWIQSNLPSHAQKNVLVLHGGWHTGKTSILRQLQAGPLGQRLRERRERPIFPVFIDLQGIPDTGTNLFLLTVAEYIASALKEYDVICSSPVEADFELAPYRAFDRFLKQVDHLLAQRANGLLVIMLDEFEKLDGYVQAGRIDAEIFSYLRSVMQHRPLVTFILAGRHRLDEMTPTYRNMVFNVALHKEVGFLSSQEAEHLIRSPIEPSAVSYGNKVVERILKLTGNHPYFIQQLCYNCIDRLNQQQQGYQVTEEYLNWALHEALIHNSLLDYLWNEEITEDDRRVLKALAHLSDDEDVWVTIPQLIGQGGLAEESGSKSLEKLEKQQLIIRDRPPEQQQDRYRYGIDMLRLWIRRRAI
jgi:GAF domain-containing protein